MATSISVGSSNEVRENVDRVPIRQGIVDLRMEKDNLQ